jgi:hypothetical protein
VWNLKDKLTRRFAGTASRVRRTVADSDGWGWKIDMWVAKPPQGSLASAKPLTNPVGTPAGVHVGQRVIPRAVYDDIVDTSVMPRIDLHQEMAISRIADARSERRATREASRTLLRGDIGTVLAGLMRYVDTHPTQTDLYAAAA